MAAAAAAARGQQAAGAKVAELDGACAQWREKRWGQVWIMDLWLTGRRPECSGNTHLMGGFDGGGGLWW